MTYRLYFNRCEDFPQIWSVDEGTIATEVNVIGFVLRGCGARDGRVEDFGAIDAAREPKAWLLIEASSLVIERGIAHFVG